MYHDSGAAGVKLGDKLGEKLFFYPMDMKKRYTYTALKKEKSNFGKFFYSQLRKQLS